MHQLTAPAVCCSVFSTLVTALPLSMLSYSINYLVTTIVQCPCQRADWWMLHYTVEFNLT